MNAENLMESAMEKKFRKAGRIAVTFIVLVILAGAIVRSTGAGMGCPDWPTCFGKIIPPTEESQLPPNYKEIYAPKGHEIATFNAARTWTEYGNRLIGALTGIAVTIATVFAFFIRRKHPAAFWLSFTAMLLTGFQGWLGKKVVDSNLSGSMVTVHMLLAIVILMIMISAVFLVRMHRVQNRKRIPGWLPLLGALTVILTVVQILIGTMVRQEVEAISIALEYQQRETWEAQLSGSFDLHKVFFMVVALASLAWVWMCRKVYDANHPAAVLSVIMIVLMMAEILAGVLTAGLDFPAALQPVHLLLANLIIAAQYVLLMYNFEGWFAFDRKINSSFTELKPEMR